MQIMQWLQSYIRITEWKSLKWKVLRSLNWVDNRTGFDRRTYEYSKMCKSTDVHYYSATMRPSLSEWLTEDLSAHDLSRCQSPQERGRAASITAHIFLGVGRTV
jgi:hypothetical protein